MIGAAAWPDSDADCPDPFTDQMLLDTGHAIDPPIG
jgi:hypothetical protein